MKINNLFTKHRENRVTTIEASNYEDDAMTLPRFDGMYTIKNINPSTSDDLFYFFPELNMIKGYVDAQNATTLNLIDGKSKLVISMVNSFYHTVLDSMSELICALEMYPEYNVVIDVSDIWDGLYAPGSQWDIFNTFVETLRETGTQVNLVRLKTYEVIYMDNFRLVQFIYESGKKSNLVYEFFKNKVTDPEAKPTRNIFVSRALVGERDEVESDGLSWTSDSRMDDHIALEKYFASLGYDIVHSEKFSSFQEQLDCFYSAKTIIGLTGSGLTNAAFMQPGGIMIEIVTPLIVSVPFPGRAKDLTKPFNVQEMHNFYKNLAYYQGMSFIGIQNPNRSFKELVDTIENTPKLKDMISRND